MGRAIKQEKTSEDHERRIKLLEDAFAEHIQTRVHHVDLTEIEDVKIEGTTLKPDEEYTEPIGKRKKTAKVKTTAVE